MALTKLIAGNWKMNGLRADGLALARAIATHARAGNPACDLLVCPPATLVAAVGEAIAGSGVVLGGQNCHAAEKGACTGDVSAEMLKDAGCSHVIIGHSERRQHCGETDADCRAKILAAWRAGLIAVLCVGETRAEREAGQEVAVVSSQLAGSLPENATPDKLATPLGLGLGTRDQPTPSQCTIRALPHPQPSAPAWPTAHTSRADTAATDCKNPTVRKIER